MLLHLCKKLLRLIVTVAAVSALTFVMVELLPGDAALSSAGYGLSPEELAQLRAELGLDKNLTTRYFIWLSGAVQGRLGHSLITHEPVLKAILHSLPASIELMVLSQALALFLAIPAGLICAWKSDTGLDRMVSALAFCTMSLPAFVISLLLIFLFALKLNWVPATGYHSLTEGVWLNFRSFLLPGFSVAIVEWGFLMRLFRSDLIDTLRENYILAARSKGLSTLRILCRHALTPSCFTLLTVLGIQVGHLLGGLVVIENIFAIPGLGRLMLSSITGRDYPMVQGCVLFITFFYVVVNFLVDFLYGLLDPRIRSQAWAGRGHG